MMDNAIHVYKDTSLSREGVFNLKDTVAHHVIVDNIADANGGSNSGN